MTLILFVSSTRRGLEAPNFAVISIFTPFRTYEKTSFTELAGRSFGPEKFRDFQETGPSALAQNPDGCCQRENVDHLLFNCAYLAFFMCDQKEQNVFFLLWFLNSSPIDELGNWCHQRLMGALHKYQAR